MKIIKSISPSYPQCGQHQLRCDFVTRDSFGFDAFFVRRLTSGSKVICTGLRAKSFDLRMSKHYEQSR